MNIAILGDKKHKMGSNVLHFNLPPKKTCTPSDWCIGLNESGVIRCYALRNNCLLPSVVDAAKKRFVWSKKKSFVYDMVGFINKHKESHSYFRIHGSGDFYSEEYVKKWVDIVKNCEETKFKVHTKRRDLAKLLHEFDELPNIIVRESLDPLRKKPAMGFPIATITGLQSENSYLCKNDCVKCGYYCWNNNSDIHGDEI